ncbi:hypothetical protein OF117_01025 [Geodermatophilus sp. YIM 151500]|uniref:hypothetical protein n=1 Tax=Geodermatophilus sp. YIM 151500 TaxID=2984531 RepID=UPI0021E49288|nr:hypothetical protein [Geodermatophilus sp. YIM 151500]MCV2487930.1 hypothetical protein [Geodermatophilus sp. YIM 151500]
MSDPQASGLRNADLLGIYCNDHLASSTGGIELVSRMLGTHRGGRWEEPLQQLLAELRDEKASLLATMAAMGYPVRQYKQLGTWVGEKLGYLKLNGRLFSRSPLSNLVEFEFLASAVRAKRSGFETLRIAAEVESRLDKTELDRLIDQANAQFEWLTRARREVAADVFGGRAQAADRTADG